MIYVRRWRKNQKIFNCKYGSYLGETILNKNVLATALVATLLLMMLLPALTVHAYEEIGPGTHHGELGPDGRKAWQIQLNKDEHVIIELHGPSGTDFDMGIECEERGAGEPEHSEHFWFSETSGSADEMVEFIVPHTGLYILGIGCGPVGGSYTLTIDIPNRVSGGGLDWTLIAPIIGVVALVAVVGIFLAMRGRGAPTVARPPTIPPSKITRPGCPFCGTPLAPGQTYCPNCKKDITPINLPAPIT